MLWAQGLSRKFRKYSSNYKSLELVLKLSFQFLKAFINEVNSPQKSISQSLHLTVRSFGPRDHHIFGGIWQYCVGETGEIKKFFCKDGEGSLSH